MDRRKGKTYEELYGVTRAQELRDMHSKIKLVVMKEKAARGKQHYRFNYHYSSEEKKQLSKRSTAGLLKYYSENQGMRITGGHWSKAGRRADLDNQYFRSSWEANIARAFNRLRLLWIYEPKRFPLYDENNTLVCTYKPDFLLPESKIYVEVKGRMTDEDRRKIGLFSKKYRLIVIDFDTYSYIEEWISNTIPFWENPQRLYAEHSEMDDDIVRTACINKDADLSRNVLSAT